MPRALIAEDETLLAENLRHELQKLWPELEIVALAPHGHAALEQALALKPELCFLDIRMPGLSGLEVATALAEDWPDAPGAEPFPLLVFVTAFDQYALQAFEHAAADYVLKPVQPERLAQTIARLKERLSAPTTLDPVLQQLRGLLGSRLARHAATPQLRLLQVGVGNTVHMVPIDDVLYFEAADKYVRAVTAAKEHVLRIALRELLPQLDEQRFWQVHRSLIVRSDAIERAVRDESGRITLHLRGHADKLAVSRVHAHLFKGL